MNDYEWRRLEQAIYRGTHPLSNPLELTLGIVAVALFIAAMGFVRHYGDWIMVHLFTLVIVIAVSLPVLAIIAFSVWFIFFTFIGRLMLFGLMVMGVVGWFGYGPMSGFDTAMAGTIKLIWHYI